MSTLFAGGLLFDGDGPPRAGLGVLVDRGQITRIAPVGQFEGLDARRVDTMGGTLMPGLIDCHVHLCSSSDPGFFATILQTPRERASLQVLQAAQDSLRGGVTSLRDLGGFEYTEMPVRDMFRAGTQLGPTMLCAGKSITITGGHAWLLSIEIDGPEAAIRAVRENVKRGADLIKMIATGGVATPNVDPLAALMTPAELDAAAAEARRLARRIAVHAQGEGGIRNAVMAGVDSIEHGFEITPEVAALMVARGVYLVPTLSAIARTLENAVGRMPPHLLEKSIRFRDMQRESFRRFVAAGGRVAMGTDAGTPFNLHGSNAQELAEMHALGMSALDCLRASTSAAADLLGLADRGRLREGAAADLLLVDGDPACDIAAVADRSRHRGVWKEGFDVRTLLGPPSAQPAAPRFLSGEAPF
jgi:imidazolonepropionase-like amidohydrolase